MKIDYTVSQLKEILKDLPDDMPVLVPGYDSGYTNMDEPTIQRVKISSSDYWKDGEFSSSEDSKDSFKALILGG